ncbi:hypothetical protein BC567DRAFT_69566 [Phyllosticta citribraziliensis]
MAIICSVCSRGRSARECNKRPPVVQTVYSSTPDCGKCMAPPSFVPDKRKKKGKKHNSIKRLDA